jgi:hypothetical protein
MRYLGQIHLAQKLGKLTVNIRKLTTVTALFINKNLAWRW